MSLERCDEGADEEERQQTDDYIEKVMMLHEPYQAAAVTVAVEEAPSLQGKQLIHSISRLCHVVSGTTVSLKDIERWIVRIEEEADPSVVESPAAMQDVLAKTFRECFPGVWVNDVLCERIRVVTVGPKIYLLPPDHFVFRETIAEALIDDTLSLPRSGHILPRHLIRFKNASLFNGIGEKVFWGDLGKKEIRRIRGPYYVLNETDSYHRVPGWAKVPESEIPASDPNRPRGIPDNWFPPDQVLLRIPYIKLKAIGIIENGKYTENPTDIRWSEDPASSKDYAGI